MTSEQRDQIKQIKKVNMVIGAILVILLGIVAGWKIALLIFLLAWNHNVDRHL